MTELQNVLLHFSNKKLAKNSNVPLTSDEVAKLVNEWKYLNEKGLSLQYKCAQYEEKDFIWKERDKALNAKNVKELFLTGTLYAAFFAGVMGFSFATNTDLNSVDLAKTMSGIFLGVEIPTVLGSSVLSSKGKILNTQIGLNAMRNQRNHKKKEIISNILKNNGVQVGKNIEKFNL